MRKNNRLKALQSPKLLWVIVLIGAILGISLVAATFSFVNFYSPTGKYGLITQYDPLILNWSIGGTNIDKCWYYYNNTNTTLPCFNGIFVEGHGKSWEGADPISNREGGFTFIPLIDTVLINVTKDPTSQATDAKITYANGTIIQNNTFSGDYSSFNVNLTKGIEYYITALDGGSYNEPYVNNVQFPIYRNNIKITGGFEYTSKGTTIANIVSITTKNNGNYTTITQSDYNKTSLIFYVNDTSGNLNATILDWDYNVFVNSETYNSTAYESSIENFVINFDYNNSYYQISQANLIYAGTSYLASITGSSGNYTAIKSLEIPIISGQQQNNSFYWQFSLTNTTSTYYFNSTKNNQSVSALSLGECSATLPYIALNITAYDQDTNLAVAPWNFKSTINYYTGSGIYKKTAYFSNLSVYEKYICIGVNSTINIDGVVEYSNSSYTSGTYYFIKTPINNNTKNLQLGFLPIASTTNFIIQLVNQNNVPVPGYYVVVNRCYANNITNCQTVHVVETDSNGQGTAPIETYTVFYQFIVKDSEGNIVHTSDTRKITPQVSPYTITITIGSNLPNPIGYLSNVSGISYNFYYNTTSKIVTLTYIDSNSSFSSANLLVGAFNASGNNKIVCNSTLTTSTGVMTCDMSSQAQGSYIGDFYVKRGSFVVHVDTINFDIETFSGTSGLLGIFGAFIILLICGFLFAYNAVAGIISLNMGIIFVNLIGLVHFGIIPITAIIAISIVILVVLERD